MGTNRERTKLQTKIEHIFLNEINILNATLKKLQVIVNEHAKTDIEIYKF